MLRRCIAVCALATAGAAAPSFAQIPPLSSTLFSFPGAFAMPPSARSASLALADRWLGDEPFDNPAAVTPRSLMLGGALISISRQDLRGDNRSYDEQAAFFDAAGASVAGAAGAFTFALYASQPVVRLEDNAFTSGTQPSSQPATVESHTSAYERRAGFAAGFGTERWRVGAALEWTGRDDEYTVKSTSGAPTSGTTTTTFSGDGIGGQLGARLKLGAGSPGTVEIGAAFRRIPEIAVDGEQSADLVAGSTTTPLAATRSASWEGGAAIRVTATPAFRVLGSLGGHYHDARDPWSFRFGGGFEQEDGVPEPRASVLGIGGSWIMDTTTIDLGLTHRRLERPGQPDSGDDRVVLGIVQRF
jgi:hypothetical protein